jgi:hypothetical protein
MAKRAGCDAVLRKPFEASVLAEALAPLLEAARHDRESLLAPASGALAAQPPEDIRAAVERAVERELPWLLDELTQRVLLALGH